MNDKYSHYFKDCPYNKIDIYRVLELFEVTNPCLAHAAKKILCAGSRGDRGKDPYRDIQEARDSLTRCLEMLDENKEHNIMLQERSTIISNHSKNRNGLTDRKYTPKFDEVDETT